MPNDKKRFLKSVNVNFISLVDKGANQKKIIFKAAHPNLLQGETYNKTVEIAKLDDDQHLVYGIVYSPGEVDTEGDFTTAEVIKQMAYDFMKNRNTNKIDKQHNHNPEEGFVAESWILEKNDPHFSGEPEGSWAVAIKVTKEDTWSKVKSGEITGLSMAGFAEVEEVQKNDLPNKKENSFTALLKSLSGSIKQSFASLKKDFSSAFNQMAVRDYVYTLERAIDEILSDETITDKKSAIMESIDQFKTALEQVEIGKSEKENIRDDKADKDNQDEITKSIHKTVIETMKPFEELQKSVNELKIVFESKSAELEKRLTTVEEKSPGSAQAASAEEVFRKDKGYKGPRWLS